MSRCRVEQDELDYDMKQGQWAPVKSLFDYADPVDELEPEIIKRPGTWRRINGGEFYVLDEKI